MLPASTVREPRLKLIVFEKDALDAHASLKPDTRPKPSHHLLPFADNQRGRIVEHTQTYWLVYPE
jgi:hypothetical protein